MWYTIHLVRKVSIFTNYYKRGVLKNMEAVNTCFESVDSLLGPGDERFFGMGFRKAQQSISNVEICPNLNREEYKGKIIAKASLWYPTDWSKKDE